MTDIIVWFSKALCGYCILSLMAENRQSGPKRWPTSYPPVLSWFFCFQMKGTFINYYRKSDFHSLLRKTHMLSLSHACSPKSAKLSPSHITQVYRLCPVCHYGLCCWQTAVRLLVSLVYGRIVECMFVCESGNVLIICNIGAHCFEDHLKTALSS